MSIVVPRKILSQQQVDLIVKHLTFTEEISFLQRKKFPFLVPKSVQMFQLIDENILLPYIFGCSLLQSRPNDQLPHQKTDFQFTGSLLERQVSVASEAMDMLNTHGTVSLRVYAGFGKTILSAYLSARLGYVSLVIYHRTVLGQQWKKAFQEHTNARIWVVEESPFPPETGYDVILCMDGQVDKLFPEVVSGIGVLITDESHLLSTETRVESLLRTHPRYIIVLSATLERNDGMHRMLQSMVGIHAVIRTAEKPFNVLKVRTGIKQESVYNARGDMDWANFIKQVLLNDERNRMVVEFVKALPKRKILILTSLVKHIEILQEMLEAEGVDVDYMARSRKKYQDCRVLISNPSKCGVGFDASNLAENFDGQHIDCLLFITSMKDEALIEQCVGRAMRSTGNIPLVVQFVDDHKTLQSHWKVAEKFYTGHNGTVKDMIVKGPESIANILYSIMPEEANATSETNTNVIQKSDSMIDNKGTMVLQYTPVNDNPKAAASKLFTEVSASLKTTPNSSDLKALVPVLDAERLDTKARRELASRQQLSKDKK